MNQAAGGQSVYEELASGGMGDDLSGSEEASLPEVRKEREGGLSG